MFSKTKDKFKVICENHGLVPAHFQCRVDGCITPNPHTFHSKSTFLFQKYITYAYIFLGQKYEFFFLTFLKCTFLNYCVKMKITF